MTQANRLPDFILKEGLQYTTCNPSARCVGNESFGETKDQYIVDLVVQRDPDGKPETATAYMPNEAACVPRRVTGKPDPECELDLLFDGDQLAQLTSSSPKIFNEPPKGHENPPPPLTGVLGDNPPLSPPPQSNIAPGLLLPAFLAGLVGGAAFTAIQLLVTHFLKKKRGLGARTVLHDPSTWEPANRFEPSKYDRMIQKLWERVSDIEVELIAQYQKSQEPNIKSVSLDNIVPDTSFAIKEPAKRMLPPLSIDIIKQAVLNWSCQVIAGYQFDFVTETIQSHRGEVDVKCFSIEGDQDDSDRRSQSEFIAISCQGVAYLIPNILPLSSVPARTIYRHLDRIYKRGVGSDLTNLERLATVRRTGDCYELVEMGQVA